MTGGLNTGAGLARSAWGFAAEQFSSGDIATKGHFMQNDLLFSNPGLPGREQASTNKRRRAFLGGALATVLAQPRLALAEDAEAPNDPFIVLLAGIYQPVPAGQGPKTNLGLTKVNLNNGTFSATKIYPVFGID